MPQEHERSIRHVGTIGTSPGGRRLKYLHAVVNASGNVEARARRIPLQAVIGVGDVDQLFLLWPHATDIENEYPLRIRSGGG